MFARYQKITFAAIFIPLYTYSIIKYGFLLGVGLGWLSSGITAAVLAMGVIPLIVRWSATIALKIQVLEKPLLHKIAFTSLCSISALLAILFVQLFFHTNFLRALGVLLFIPLFAFLKWLSGKFDRKLEKVVAASENHIEDGIL